MMSDSGKIASLNVSARKGEAKSRVEQVRLKEDFGIEGDAHGGSEVRQVSLLSVESIRKMQDLGAEVLPGAFAENITTDGVDLSRVRVGHRILSGTCELLVTQLGKECHDRCAIFEQVGDCVMPREGVFARVTRGGVLRVGDAIEIAPPEESP